MGKITLFRDTAKELLLFAADGVDATRASQKHLATREALVPSCSSRSIPADLALCALHSGEVRGCQLSQATDEGWLIVERLGSLEFDAVLLD